MGTPTKPKEAEISRRASWRNWHLGRGSKDDLDLAGEGILGKEDRMSKGTKAWHSVVSCGKSHEIPQGMRQNITKQIGTSDVVCVCVLQADQYWRVAVGGG